MTTQTVPTSPSTNEAPEPLPGPTTGGATPIPASLPHLHGHCGKRWAGARTAHCGSCCETFSGETTFNRHRRDGKCLNPATLGMTLDTRRTYPCWGNSDEVTA